MFGVGFRVHRFTLEFRAWKGFMGSGSGRKAAKAHRVELWFTIGA